jgi:hypothetical protein
VPENNSSRKYSVGLIILLVSLALLRLRLINIPLERDEGEYAYMGSLILKGLAPYKAAYNMKLPGTYAMYAIILAVLGKSITAIHLGLMIINLATVSIFYLAFKRLLGSSIALFAAACYGFCSYSDHVLGFAAHATHFVNLFISLGWLFLAYYYENNKTRNSFFLGLMFGLAFLMKQQAVYFLLFGGFAIAIVSWGGNCRKSIKAVFTYGLGVILPYLITALIISATGAFDKFWFWTVDYARAYTNEWPLQKGISFLRLNMRLILTEQWPIWIAALSILITIFYIKIPKQKKSIIIFYGVFAVLSVTPGFYFRGHYFVTLLPAVALGAPFLYITSGVKSSNVFKTLYWIFFPSYFSWLLYPIL